ncbi:hypothetical protein, partial [Ruoffia sp. FAM 26254]|uniref:hypothetical protein n=1 Tax=Ruoffia sp. FAM 26254 TaxID=3259518 RepID=UPI003884FA4F
MVNLPAKSGKKNRTTGKKRPQYSHQAQFSPNLSRWRSIYAGAPWSGKHEMIPIEIKTRIVFLLAV